MESKQQIKLGFIGIGLMGKPMVLRLLDAGFQVYVWSRSPEKLPAVTERGAEPCATIAELVWRSDVILLCLADTAVVESVVRDSILGYGAPDKLLIDLSSIDPDSTRRLAAELKQRCGMGWVDAPVSGGVAGAADGSLAIMAGGAAEHIALARVVLAPLYRQLTHMGAVGSGQVTKICNQMIVSCNVLVIAEMMALAQRAGVNAEQIPAALAGGFADSKPLQITGFDMAQRRFEPVKWRVKTLLKDLRMAGELSEKQGSAIPMSALAAQLLQWHGSRGFLEHDPATLIELFAQDADA